MNKLFTTVLPSVMAGALLFGSALSGAQPGTPVPPTPPSAPVPGSPAMPPKPPKAPKLKGHVNIDLGDLDQMVDEQIENALEAIGDNDQIPEHVRESLKKRLEKVRVKVKARIGKLSPSDFDKMGEELGKMGDEIGAEMDQFGKDMDKWGKDFEKQMKAKHFKWKGQHGPDVQIHIGNDEDDMPGMDMSDMDDMDDMDDAVRDLGDLNLDTAQRGKLKQLRVNSEQEVATAKAELDRASEALAKLLANGSSNEADISNAIDRVSGLEARIRKARIMAWVKARGVLDGPQRDKLERAARGKSR